MTAAYPAEKDHPAVPMGALYAGHPPVSRIVFPSGHEGWLVTRYDDVRAVFSDPRFSRRLLYPGAPCLIEPGDFSTGEHSILNMDPPGHTRLRRLSAQAFTVRRIAALRPRIQEIADDLLRAMTGHGPPADLVEEFAFPLPTAVICELLGVPFAGRERLLLRVALEDVELGGVLVRRGEAVLAHVGAANRDENVFPDAAAFDIRRKAAPQLGFGHGVHFCLGAALARLEGEIALRTLVDRLPGLDLAVPPESIAWRPPLSVRGPEEVPVTWAV